MIPLVGTLLGGLLGGGGGGGGFGLSASDSSTTSSESGDASSALSMPFSYGGNIQAGGKGNSLSTPTNQTASASATAGTQPLGGIAQADNNIVYVALGVAALAVISSAFRSR